MDLCARIEEKLNQYAKRMIEGGAKLDEHALGEMTFYTALRRVVTRKATPQDVGMMDAVNDTLQALGVIESGETFYRK